MSDVTVAAGPGCQVGHELIDVGFGVDAITDPVVAGLVDVATVDRMLHGVRPHVVAAGLQL